MTEDFSEEFGFSDLSDFKRITGKDRFVPESSKKVERTTKSVFVEIEFPNYGVDNLEYLWMTEKEKFILKFWADKKRTESIPDFFFINMNGEVLFNHVNRREGGTCVIGGIGTYPVKGNITNTMWEGLLDRGIRSLMKTKVKGVSKYYLVVSRKIPAGKTITEAMFKSAENDNFSAGTVEKDILRKIARDALKYRKWYEPYEKPVGKPVGKNVKKKLGKRTMPQFFSDLKAEDILGPLSKRPKKKKRRGKHPRRD